MIASFLATASSFAMSLIAFLFVLTVVVVVHEWGHFFVAKRVGIRVFEFSIGFPPRLFRLFHRKGTDYIVGMLPIGGYVRMAGMEFDESATTSYDPQSSPGGDPEVVPKSELFSSKTAFQRFLVLFAGPAMNYILAFVLFTGLIYATGVPVPDTTNIQIKENSVAAQAGLQTGDKITAINTTVIQKWRDVVETLDPKVNPQVEITVQRNGSEFRSAPLDLGPGADKIGLTALFNTIVGDVQRDSPAEKGGLKKGDIIASINGHPMQDWEMMADTIHASPNLPLTFVVQREDQAFTTIITPQFGNIPAEDNTLKKAGLIGIRLHWQNESVSFITAVIRGGAETVGFSLILVEALQRIVKGQVSRDDVGGPVAIGKLAGDSARWGFHALLRFTAILSVQLAILNLIIPIPVLDGGQIFFIALEKLRGRPLSRESRMRLAQVGVFMLLCLMIFVTILDITR